MTNIIIGSAVTGTATLLSAFALQKLYEKTDFYPPNPVFWFFIGVTAHIGVNLSSRLLSSTGMALPALPGLSGFGESVEDLDKKIDTYQKHIASLNRVLIAGSAAGKQQAQQKIAEEQRILQSLLNKREDLVQD